MNNAYLTPLLCMMVLAFAPACCKRQENAAQKEDVKKMIELDDAVFEEEIDDETNNTSVKF